jgi:hypothetical protein
MAQSLTDWLQQSRYVVIGVDRDQGRIRIKSATDACTDLSCTPSTLVLGDEAGRAGLDALQPGDIVRVDGRAGQAERIHIVRRVWDELTSPEF